MFSFLCTCRRKEDSTPLSPSVPGLSLHVALIHFQVYIWAIKWQFSGWNHVFARFNVAGTATGSHEWLFLVGDFFLGFFTCDVEYLSYAVYVILTITTCSSAAGLPPHISSLTRWTAHEWCNGWVMFWMIVSRLNFIILFECDVTDTLKYCDNGQLRILL